MAQILDRVDGQSFSQYWVVHVRPITTDGKWSSAITAWSSAGGNSIINYDDGMITTAGYRAFGLHASPFGSGDGTVNFTAGTINTSGYEAVGAHVYVTGPGALTINAGAGAIVNTSGTLANGLLGTIETASNAAALSITSASEINTTGEQAHGIWGWHGGSGGVFIKNTGNVTTSGMGADGLRATGAGTGIYDVDAIAGTVIGGTGTGAGIHTIGKAGGTIDIADIAVIDGSASGVAIRDGDYDSDGTDETGGNVVVTTAGTVIGDAILGLGDDIFNLTGGAYTGNIYGDDIAASKNDGDDQFNWSGGDLNSGFFGQNGSDTATISAGANYEGTEILDGGDDASSGDGWVDVLTLDGITVTANTGKIINWEVINITNGADVSADAVTTEVVNITKGGAGSISNLKAGVVNVCAGSATIGGASSVVSVLGCVSDDSITITDDATITNQIQGAGGADTITVSGNASVTGGVYGGENGQDGSAAADTGDVVTIDTTGSVGRVLGGAGEDRIFLKNGTVTDFISGGDDNDYIEASGGETEIIVGNDGDDTILVTGTAKVISTKLLPDETSIDGNAGNDIIQIDGNAIVSGVDGDDGDDTLLLYGGEITTTFATGNGGSDGGAGEDLIILDGTKVHGALGGGLDNDTILIKSGSAAIVAGLSHDDHIVMTGGDVDILLGDVGGLFDDPNTGNDKIELLGGNVGTVMGDEGDDVIILDGATISGTIAGDTIPSIYNPAPLPGSGDDQFIWTSGTMAAFDGGDGSDTADVSAAEYDGSQILDGGDDVAVADGWIDTLTLDGLTVTVNGGNIINWENVVVDGGMIAFSDNMIEVGSDTGTGMTLQNGAVLDATSNPLSIIGNLTNNAIVDMQDGATGDSVSVSNDYSGTGALQVDTDFATDTSDTLVVGGNVTGGTTTVSVGDVSSGDATGNDVLVVDVAGTSSAGDFALVGDEIIAGPYAYTLNLESDTNWYLQSTVLPQVEAYAPALSAIQSMGRDFLGNLWERVGHRETGWSAEGRGNGTGVWGRAHGKLLDAGSGATSSGASFETAHGFLQAGVDFAGFDLDEGNLVLSIMGHYGNSDTDVANVIGGKIANVDINGYGVGGSVTFYNEAQTFYLDAVGQATWYDVDIDSTEFGLNGSERTAHANTDGFGYGFSLEAGYRYAISDQWAFVPQGQLTYSNTDFDNTADSEGVALSVLDGDSLEGRIGFALEGHSDVSFGYFRVNLIEEFEGKNRINASGTKFTADFSGTSAELSAGGSFLVTPGVRLYTDITGRAGFKNEVASARGTIGAKVNW